MRRFPIYAVSKQLFFLGMEIPFRIRTKTDVAATGFQYLDENENVNGIAIPVHFKFFKVWCYFNE